MTPALIRHLPAPAFRAGEPEPIVPAEMRAGLDALAPDFELLERVLVPAFGRLDADALRAQNMHRLLQLALIVGAAVAAVLGAWQAAAGDSSLPGFLEGLLGALLAGVVALLHARGYHRRYLDARLAAERLRGEYFLFLARAAGYAGDDAAARARLAQQVEAITADAER